MKARNSSFFYPKNHSLTLIPFEFWEKNSYINGVLQFILAKEFEEKIISSHS